MTSVFEEISPELLALATDEELNIYIAGLEAEIVASEKDWRLHARQQRAEDLLQNLDPTRSHELLYGGAVGGGKTDFMLWHLYHLALQYPGFSGLMLRRTYKQLARTVIKRSFQCFDRKLCKWNGVDKMWRFTNGSVIEFGYCDNENDVYNYDSAEYDCVCWDELTQWPNDENYLYLFSRIRTRTALADQGLVGHMVAGTNPGRVGGAWVKARWVDVGDPEEVVEVEDDQSDLISNRVFVPSKLDDNPSINKRQYRANLSALGPKKRKQLEDGDWDVIEGQYFDEWDRALHVMAPFEIPEYWPRARGLDFGYANPMCVLWGAFDPDGVCYVYRELYGTGMVPTIQARRVTELTVAGENIDYTTADPSIWTRTGAGPPIAEQYARAGLRCRKANNARIDGWMRTREFLRVDELTGMPRLRIFNHCLNLIRTLPMLVHDHDNPEDLDTTGEDHAGDALRYLLMSRPRASRPVKTEAASLDQRHFENVKRRRHSRTSTSMVHPDLGSW